VPEPQEITRFSLLLRQLAVLHGWSSLRALDAEAALALLDRGATEEADRHALGAFRPLVARGFLTLLDGDGQERRERAGRLAQQVTIRAEQLEWIAERIAPLVAITPVPAMEALALAQATRTAALRQPRAYNPTLLWVVLGVLALATAALALLVQGARRRVLDRAAPASPSAPTLAPPPAPPSVRPPAPSSPVSPESQANWAATRAAPGLPAAETREPAVVQEPAAAQEFAAALPWRACAGLPAAPRPPADAVAPWSVVAPASALDAVRGRCVAQATVEGDSVILARFADRADAERLTAVLTAESGLSLQLVAGAAP
jgi:hypothetical protein